MRHPVVRFAPSSLRVALPFYLVVRSADPAWLPEIRTSRSDDRSGDSDVPIDGSPWREREQVNRARISAIPKLDSFKPQQLREIPARQSSIRELLAAIPELDSAIPVRARTILARARTNRVTKEVIPQRLSVIPVTDS